MSAYYKTINGKHYDRAMLDVADSTVNKKKDGKISLADAKKIIGKASDAGTITETEAQTLHYIFDHYKFTKSAEEYFSNFAFLEKGKKLIPEEEKQEPDNDIFGFKEFMARYYLVLIIIALVIFLLYLYSDSLKTLFNTGRESAESVKTEQVVTQVEEPKQQEVKTVTTAGENEYIVQKEDTLFGISAKLFGDPSKWQFLYDRNKDIIEKPSMIYPGQKLRTDIK